MTRPRLRLLGGFDLSDSEGRKVDVPAKKNRALLGILALSPQGETTRERLMGLLWADRGEEQARSSLRQALVALRKNMAPITPDPLILAGDQVTLDLATLAVDVVEFLDGALDTELDKLRPAARLYAGAFLDGLAIDNQAFEDWLRETRGDLAARAIAIHELLTSKLTGSSRIAAGQKLVALDPLREASHGILVEALMAEGERGLARKQLETCRLLLKRELGVEPGARLHQLQQSLDEKARERADPSPLEKNPVVVVLPFENLSGDPDQRYFSDGLTEDIIDRLSRFRLLSVVGRHSSFAFRERAPTKGEMRTLLKADYVVTGSVRKSERRIRVSALLSDAESEIAIWADRFDRPLEDIFDIQDDVASLIASILAKRLEVETTSRSSSKRPANLSSYEYVLRGNEQFKKVTRSANEQALACFERAIELDPRSAEAHCRLALCYTSRWLFDFSKEDVEKGVGLAAAAIDYDPTNAKCYLVYGFSLLCIGRLDAAETPLKQAHALNPVEPDILANLGLLCCYQGNLPEAKKWIEQAFKLDPLPPPWYSEYVGIVAFFENRYQDAFVAFEPVQDAAWDAMYALSCYGHLGLGEKAKACLANFRRQGRELKFLEQARAEPYRNPDHREQLAAGVEKALAL